MTLTTIYSRLLDINANLDCGDVGGAQDELENLLDEMEKELG